MVPIGRPWLAEIAPPQTLPAWLSEADIKFYTGEFARSGFRGGLNWYRNIDRNWELLAPWKDAKLQIPTLYMVGDRDLVYRFAGMDTLIPNLKNFVPKLEKTILLEGCGHWTQQERAADHFDQVLVLERDTLPSEPAHRAGTPQARHVHALLLSGQRALGELFPGF